MSGDREAERLQNVWHICLRGRWPRAFFLTADDYQLFRSRVLLAVTQRGGTLLDYCLMPVEIRLLVELGPGQSPGRFLQSALSAWAKRINERDRLEGHVFVGRTGRQAVADAAELRRIVLFLARYPVDCGFASRPSAYRYGGYRAHLGLDAAAGLGVPKLLRHFGASLQEGRRRLRAAVRRNDLAPHEVERLRRLRERAIRVPHSQRSTVVAAAAAEARLAIVRLVEQHICRRMRIAVRDLFAAPTPPGVTLVRAMIVHFLTSRRVSTQAALARRYGRRPQTLAEEIARYRSQIQVAEREDAELEMKVRTELGIFDSDGPESSLPRGVALGERLGAPRRQSGLSMDVVGTGEQSILPR